MQVAESGPSEDSLRDAAHRLNELTVARQIQPAWDMYSQRCQAKYGDVDTYGYMIEAFYRDRTPDISGVTVKVNGSSGQVVTVDNDPSAPADAMDPRTWTYIDGRWQFDNC